MVAVAAVVAVAGCAPRAGGHSLIGDPTPIGNIPSIPTTPVTTVAPTTTSPPTTVAPTTTTALPSLASVQPARPYAVGWTLLDLTDPSRKTGTRAGRHLPTLVFYPAVGGNPGAETQGAAGLYHSWPVVVFAHGYNVTPLTYHDLIHHLASSGFVVAAPSFPLETAGAPLDENDLSNEPADIKFVLTEVLAAGRGRGC